MGVTAAAVAGLGAIMCRVLPSARGLCAVLMSLTWTVDLMSWLHDHVCLQSQMRGCGCARLCLVALGLAVSMHPVQVAADKNVVQQQSIAVWVCCVMDMACVQRCHVDSCGLCDLMALLLCLIATSSR
jgi:hypothetical protein